mmetsp:Transcript_15410/g.53996  ORF Transcript_15410/g.53996 Transcript_15410/m.53996 type:complete len:184 (-) Transcript_15410:100-651(-)
MLIPLPAMPSPGGPPSRYFLSMRPWFLALLIVQSICVVAQLFLILDIMGGFINGICLGLGWYAWHQDMHITFICYWGFMGLINGAFDIVRFIDMWVHLRGPLFSKDDAARNIINGFRILGPISFVLGAWMAYRFYSRQGEAEANGGGDWAQRRAAERQPIADTSWQGPRFQTFGGQGQRLGTD